MTTSTEKQLPASRVPTHIAYQVRDLDSGKAFWTRIGRAWTNADGKGFSIQLESVPLDGRITLRVESDKSKYHTKQLAFAAGLRQHCTDIIRFSHGASSSRKVYRSSFIPGLHDVCMVFEKTK